MSRLKKGEKKNAKKEPQKDYSMSDAAVKLAEAVAETLGLTKGSVEVGFGKSGEIPGWVVTGVPQLDYAVGGFAHPGFPLGRIVEIHGAESSGKTTVSLLIMKSMTEQYPDTLCDYQDLEKSLNNDMLRGMGISADSFIHSHVSKLEDVFREQLAAFSSVKETGKRACFVVDSIAMSQSNRAMEGEVGDTQVADIARVMSSELKKTVTPIKESESLVVWVNQMRTNVGVMYGDPHVTPGGDTMKYVPTVRLRFLSGEKIKSADGKFFVGLKVHARVFKSKISRPGTDIQFTIDYNEDENGSYVTVDKVKAQIEWCAERGLIQRAGAYYVWGEGKHYLSALTKKIKSSKEEMEKLRELAYSIKPMPSNIKVDVETGEVIEGVDVNEGESAVGRKQSGDT